MVKYKITFRGELLPGCDKDQVETHFAALFGVRAAVIQPYFNKRKVFLKSGMDLDKARKYAKTFRKLGLVFVVKPSLPRSTGTAVVKHKATIDNELAVFDSFDEQAASAKSEPTEHDAQSAQLKRKASVAVCVAIGLFFAVFGLDSVAQKSFIDITRMPYILPALAFCYALMRLGEAKGYPKRASLLGIISICGFAVMLMLPNRNKSLHGFLYRQHRVIPLLIFFTTVLWAMTQFQTFNAKVDFIATAQTMERIRSDYPINLIENSKTAVNQTRNEMQKFVAQCIADMQQVSFRPKEMELMTEIMLKEISNYFIWLQYQRYLHARTSKKIPSFFSDAFVKEEIARYKKTLRSAKPFRDYPPLAASYANWVKGFDASRIENLQQLQQNLVDIKRALDEYVQRNNELPTSMRILVAAQPDIAHLLNDVDWDGQGTMALSTGASGKLATETVVMAYYQIPKQKKNIFTRIGGTLPDKYMANTYRVLSGSYRIGNLPIKKPLLKSKGPIRNIVAR